MKHWGWIALGCLPLITLARPDLSQKVGPTLADTGSAYYRFERFELDSTDGRRHYRIHLAVPKRAAPAEGYPALYLLDGNAVNAELREDWLAEMDERGPPLLVMIGYATELRFDVDARVYDYTPAPQPGQPLLEDEERRRPAGGAAQFLDLIEQRIKPHVTLHHPVDPQRQGLWGHSYGGASCSTPCLPAHRHSRPMSRPSLRCGGNPACCCGPKRNYRSIRLRGS